ncbi:MAG: response regulator [bacterium]|nr:response regulator [bacterium]
MESKTVLVIEDNELNMKLTRIILTMGNYRVLEAKDAETGIQLIREQQPDLILMDIQLPGMDGLSATRLIKSEPKLRHIPIIALTSYAMRKDEKTSKEAGCEGHVTKPVSASQLLETVARYVRHNSSHDSGD